MSHQLWHHFGFVEGNYVAFCNHAAFVDPPRTLIISSTVIVDKSTIERQCALTYKSALKLVLEAYFAVIMETDGATDGNPKHPRVLAYYVALSKLLNIPLLIVLVNAPGNSWVNTHELCMTDMSFALSGSVFERKKGPELFEIMLKTCNRTVSKVRKAFENNTSNKEIYKSTVKPAIDAVNECFSKLRLHDQPYSILQDPTDLDYENFQKVLHAIDPKLVNPKNMWKTSYVQECPEWQKYVDENVGRQDPYRVLIRNPDALNALPDNLKKELEENPPPSPVMDSSGKKYKP